jgi:putative ABC transport system ATP-binding protein
MSDLLKEQTDAVVSVRGVDFSYVRRDGSLLGVLKHMSFTIGYGEVVGLVGRNGAGKTTLLEVLRGTLPPQKGEVQVGMALVAIGGNHRQKPSVAMISQRPDAGLAPTMTVYENYAIAIGHGMSGLRWAYSKRTESACRDLMARAGMGIEDKAHEQARFLSGGQQQAVSVLLALESPERLLLMDEPTASLDPFAAKTLLDLAVSEIERVRGAILLVSHRLRDIVERCSRIFVLDNGTITRDINCFVAPVTEQELLASMASSVGGVS